MDQVDRPIHQHSVSSDVKMRSEPVELVARTAVHLSNVKQGSEQSGTLGGAVQKTRNEEPMGSPEHVRLHTSLVHAGSVTQGSQVDPAEAPTSTQQQESEPKLSDSFQPIIHHQQQRSESRSSQHVTQQQQQQNDLTQLTQLLIKQQVRASLPHQKITTFDGDPLKYTTFIKAFEYGVEEKTEEARDRLMYLCLYTSGDAKTLVNSCLHYVNPEEGYLKAKELLQKRFGNSHKIAQSALKRARQWRNQGWARWATRPPLENSREKF